jgi:hypothetical protein
LAGGGIDIGKYKLLGIKEGDDAEFCFDEHGKGGLTLFTQFC